MATLVSNWSTNKVFESFIAPLEKRAEKDVLLGNDVPIIDLQHDHHLVVQQFIKACQDFGLFQLVAMVIGPDYSCTIEPAKVLLSQDNPPLYRPYLYAEFVEIYLSDKSEYVAGVKPYA